MKIQFLVIALTVVSGSLLADEHTVTLEDFEKKVTLEGVALPVESKVLRIEPQAWESFVVEKTLPQGAAVAAGAIIVQCDAEALDLKIAEEEAAKKVRDLELAAARLELADLETNTPRQLSAADVKFQRAKEDLRYFKEIGRKVKEEAMERSVDRAKRQLEYQTEELEQLLKMYAEDDLTEETEEIILKRQRSAVKEAQNYVERSIISRDKVLETDLPRELVDLSEKLESAELALASKRESLPRALAQKKLAVGKLALAHELADQKLDELREDRSLMVLKSPVEGHFYFGEIAEGRWSAGQSAKILRRGGKLPKHVNFATVVPAGAFLQVEAAVGESEISALTIGQEGVFSPEAWPRKKLPGTIKSLASHPNLAGAYPLVFELSEQQEGLVTGMTGTIAVVCERVQGAVVLPVTALEDAGDGTYSVLVKVGGDFQKRAVTLGPEDDGQVVILEGLHEGEVVRIGQEDAEE